jgi:hypothetical protein
MGLKPGWAIEWVLYRERTCLKKKKKIKKRERVYAFQIEKPAVRCLCLCVHLCTPPLWDVGGERMASQSLWQASLPNFLESLLFDTPFPGSCFCLWPPLSVSCGLFSLFLMCWSWGPGFGSRLCLWTPGIYMAHHGHMAVLLSSYLCTLHRDNFCFSSGSTFIYSTNTGWMLNSVCAQCSVLPEALIQTRLATLLVGQLYSSS